MKSGNVFGYKDGEVATAVSGVNGMSRKELYDALLLGESSVSNGLRFFGNLELEGTSGQLWCAEVGLCVIRSLGGFRLACLENV